MGAPRKERSSKKKLTKKGKEKKEAYSVTLTPSNAAKAEHLAMKNRHSFSNQLDIIIEEHFEKK